MKIHAVLTGDIINFTRLNADDRKKLINDTEILLKSWIKKRADAEVFRGDSFQVLFDDVTDAVRRSIQLICWFMQHSDEKNKINLGTRISIGTGEISYRGKNVLNSDGEAFHLSGRNFDLMKPGEYLAIHTNDQYKNKGIEIILNFLNKYISDWSLAQAEVVFLVLEGKTQQEIAEHLSLSQPSVNSRLKLAGWKEFEPAIKYISHLAANE